MRNACNLSVILELKLIKFNIILHGLVLIYLHNYTCTSRHAYNMMRNRVQTFMYANACERAELLTN